MEGREEKPEGMADGSQRRATDRRRLNAPDIMFTTWRNKHGLLAPFGDLVAKRVKP